MDANKIKEILNTKGVSFTYHSLEKLRKENITRSDVFLVLRSGVDSKPDSSVRNDKSLAWNNAQHESISYNDITVVFCIGKDGVLVINTVFHGFPHDFLSNQYNKNLKPLSHINSNLKVFR